MLFYFSVTLISFRLFSNLVDYFCIHYCIWLFLLQLVKLVKAEKFSNVPPLNYSHGSCSMVSLVLPIAFSTAVTIVILVISRIILWSCRTVVDYLGFTKNSSKNSTFTKPITLFKSHIKYVTSLSCHRHDKNKGMSMPSFISAHYDLFIVSKKPCSCIVPLHFSPFLP